MKTRKRCPMTYFADPKDNPDFGECRYAVQLFPVGAYMSTLEDISKFGLAFVAQDCPLFEMMLPVRRCSGRLPSTVIQTLQKTVMDCGQINTRSKRPATAEIPQAARQIWNLIRSAVLASLY